MWTRRSRVTSPAQRGNHALIITLLLAFLTAPSSSAGDAPSAAEDRVDESPIEEFDRDHWSFRPINAPRIPRTSDASWPRTSIDHFILAPLEGESIVPAAPADRETLIRRLVFDLTGLPPSTEQLDRFIGDQRPGAYRRLVDRLLSSPQYGRRWGQYWLDLARFAETDGFEHDKVRPSAWKYRDWVIDALNDDLPFNHFVSLQIAGDVIHPDDADASVATAFCLSGPDMPDINSQEERKHVLMNEVTATVAETLLSLQMGCAQCHDHKYDAISQGDFYRLRAFFDPAVKLKANESVTTLRPDADPESTSRLFHRGDWRSPGPVLSAAFPRIANVSGTRVAAADPGGKRRELARWLTDPLNPMVPRSIVNRIWQYHFGRGLSSTPSDFGVMGNEPTHPELLDHLASRLISNQWSLKNLHREIVLSSVYRTQSRPPQSAGPGGEQRVSNWRQAVATDPENQLLARFPRRRLDAESIRDAMFACSGSLNDESGGPGVNPPLPKELIQTLKSGQWKMSPREADHYRRSIYIFARRNLRYPMFATFDRPAANCSCAVRHSSTTAVQSLLLLNSKITLDAATRLANVVSQENGDPTSQCADVYRRVLSREPRPSERKECVAFLLRQTDLLTGEGHADAKKAALVDLCRAMFNANPFLYVD